MGSDNIRCFMVVDLENGQPLLEYKRQPSDRRNVSTWQYLRPEILNELPIGLNEAVVSLHCPGRSRADSSHHWQFAGEAMQKATGFGKQQLVRSILWSLKSIKPSHSRAC
eukprot:SAG11_NODE_8664_length_989_cov_1.688764_1_plen_110_part_00